MDPIDVGVRPGDVLAGKYRVEQVLGVGGMGVVVAAHHLLLDEKVALKFLRSEALGNPEQVARFAREARAAVKIKSEHVARVIDVGSLDNGAPYIVMEYLEGGDLAGMLATDGPLPFVDAVDFILQATEAIAQAHALGIVHRDLKPSNLFCIRGPDSQLSIKVLDFGISKAMAGALGSGSADMGMTRTTAVVGSPVYMSPEQMHSSKNVDLRTDIWSLGVVLYELVTGRIPFDGDTVTELAILIATQPTAPPSTFRPDLPAGLERVILCCLEKTRERRYQNVAELAAALVEFGSKRAGASLDRIRGTLLPGPSRAAAASSPMISPGVSTESAWQGVARPKRSGRVIIGIAGGVAVTALLGGLLATTWPSPHVPSASSSVDTRGVNVTSPPSSTVEAPSSSGAASSTTLDAAVQAPSAVPPANSAAATPSPRPTATPRAAAPSATARGKAKAGCDTPYYFDGQGNRVFKRECL